MAGFPMKIAGKMGIILLCLGIALISFTNYLFYPIFALAGLIFYLLTFRLGKEIYFFLLFPALFLSVNLLEVFFGMNYNNLNGYNPLKLHPVAIAWLVVFILEVFGLIRNRKIKADVLLLLSLTTLICFFGITFWHRKIYGMPLFIENYLVPISFFYFFYSYKDIRYEKVTKIIGCFLFFAVIIGLYGLIEFALKMNVFEGIYQNASWYASTFLDGYRIKTVIGHPLDNGIFFLAAMILVQITLQRNPLRNFLLLLFAVDIVLTGSRIMGGLAVLVFLYDEKLLQRKRGLFMKAFLLTFFLLIVLETPFGATFRSRIRLNLSNESRLILLEYFGGHFQKIEAGGLGAANEENKIYNHLKEKIIMENPWIILFYDVGFFCFLYIGLVCFLFGSVTNRFLFLIVILALSSSNSFGVKSTGNDLLYFLASILYLKRIRGKVQNDRLLTDFAAAGIGEQP